jgi:hypothetical protein
VDGGFCVECQINLIEAACQYNRGNKFEETSTKRGYPSNRRLRVGQIALGRQIMVLNNKVSRCTKLALLLLGLVSVFYARPLRAQLGTANLSGTVLDASGGGVPGAKLTLQSTAENAHRETSADAAGRYQIPAILPGTYQLVVTAAGFQTTTIDNIALESGQGSTLDVSMQLGKSVTEVTVTQAATLLETTTATVGSEITEKQFTELPMLGRNFTSLILILPGVAPVPPPDSINTSVGGISVNPSVMGQRQRSNSFVFDGLPNAEVIFNGVPMYPPPEAIAEMKVESGMDTGAQGWASGASINLVSKAGTNQYHGDLWEYVRNDSLNARSYFDAMVPAIRWNQFGVAVGGPVQIPHLVSKERNWYVFGYYEGLRIPNHSSFYAFVPTAAELGGDFSALGTPIYNPYTTAVAPNGSVASRQQFPGNIIPTGTTTACAPNPTCIDPAAVTLTKAFLPVANLAPGVVPGENFVGTSQTRDSPNQYSIRVDHQFGSKDNFFSRFSESREIIDSLDLPPWPAIPNEDKRHMDNLGFSETHSFSPTSTVTGRFGWQRFNWNVLTGGPDVAKEIGTLDVFPAFHGMDVIPGQSIPGYSGMGQGVQIYGPENLYTITVDAQKIKGAHTLLFGGTFWKQNFITDNYNGSESYSVTPTAAADGTGGDPYASFLLGLPSTASREFGSTEAYDYGHAFGLYMQDSFRATRKLTVNYGLRWEFAEPFVNKAGSGLFTYETGQYYWDMKNPITGQPANIRRGVISPDYHGFGPRLGIAYQLPGKTVVRASYAIFFDTFGNGYAQTQQGDRGDWPFAFPQTAADLNTAVPSAPLVQPFPSPTPPTPPSGFEENLNAWPSSSRVPYVNQWSFSLQHEFSASTTGELSYFGSLGVKNSGQIVDNVALTPGTDPYQNRQRYPSVPPNVLNGYNEFCSWYDGLVAKVTMRASRNLTLMANYTWSKTMDMEDSFVNGGLYGTPFSDPTRFTLGLNKGPAGFDVTNIINVSYVYNVPIKTQSKLANAVVGGWSTSGNIHFDSGVPYFIVLTSDNENIGFVGRNVEFPNLVADPNSGFTRSLNEWFNTSAYVIPPFGTRGYAGRHALYSDPESNWDAAVYKKWFFKETRDVEFRGEFFNLPNSHTFDPAGALEGEPQFGTISAVRQMGRQIQFALKVHF